MSINRGTPVRGTACHTFQGVQHHGKKRDLGAKTREIWQLGEGSYVLNEDAPIDTLLGDASEWLATAWYLADEVANRAAMGRAANNEELREKLGTVRMLAHMGVQCVRVVRRKLIWDERVQEVIVATESNESADRRGE